MKFMITNTFTGTITSVTTSSITGNNTNNEYMRNMSNRDSENNNNDNTKTTTFTSAIFESMFLQKQQQLREIIYDDNQHTLNLKHKYNTFHMDNNHGSSNSNNNHNQQQQQQLIIMGGPHHTQTNQIQSQLWQWTKYKNSNNSTQPILHQWMFPIPLPIIDAEFIEMEVDNHHWTPPDIYYPLLEALRTFVVTEKVQKKKMPKFKIPNLPSRLLFQKYKIEDIFDMVQEEIRNKWNMGYSLMMGTDAFNHIMTFPEINRDFIKTFLKRIIPQSTIPSDKITFVVTYTRPKVQQLITAWQESTTLRGASTSFRDWLIKGTYQLYVPVDALGMVQFILDFTDWNVVVIDSQTVQQSQYMDMTHFIACKVMEGTKCDVNGLVGFDDDKNNDRETILMHRSSMASQKSVNLDAKGLEKIENVLSYFECKYQRMFRNHMKRYKRKNGTARLKVYDAVGILDTMKSHCDGITYDQFFGYREIKRRITKILQEYK